MVNTNGNEADGASYAQSLSADGGLVTFHSYATNLVPDDLNDLPDVFVHDRQLDGGSFSLAAVGFASTIRVSVGHGGVDSDGASLYPSLSADGRWLAFKSSATNLVEADTNDTDDIFVHDRSTGITTRVSVATEETQANAGSNGAAIGHDGRYLVFHSNTSNLVMGDDNAAEDIFIHDRQTRQTARISADYVGNPADDFSYRPALGADSRYVVFESHSHLVENDSSSSTEIFLAVNPLFSAAFDDELSIAADSDLVVIPVLLNNRDFQGDPLTVIDVVQPDNGSMWINPDNTVSYTPNPGFIGIDSFTYTVADSDGETASALVTVTIFGLRPVAANDTFVAAQDQSLIVPAPGVLANDSDPENDPLTSALVTNPLHGAISFNSDGSFSYFPEPLYSGTDSFTYQASDGTQDSNEATVSILVSYAPLARTGQTTCYDVGDVEIDCTELAAAGQDAEKLSGVPSPVLRFVVNGDGTVTDRLTGLIWLQNADCFDLRSWQSVLDDANTLADGQCGLADGSVEGDWRLPNVKELRSLIDHGRFSPALPAGHPFESVQVTDYWSSTNDVLSPNRVWLVEFYWGIATSSSKAGNTFHVWPVRGKP